mmetsp:Transcript_21686/g.32039  ORF Transcript_21686/g.32039 Transcript_21686/m.32039 type:complete len:400 (-) Transcript_21686:76-1275(-)|eukprot:CAMPEP_0194217290 /NCGR_PEP_ID=MMETSP0156-20130528/20913_1 /TAXON_ID=33649 /ORGANISM="Thalassionema nitzschioides, Strain L26-B" /LENGTH=399 /DNA_ID=CAMNT_0038946303 /DNA_START=67 /DNA_END=1266 /DNA_ORIENTATION=+
MIPEQLAKYVVGKLMKRVNSIIESSTVIDDSQKDDTFAIFENRELNLGKVIGRGGFSDVYEICNFSLIEESRVNRVWTNEQQNDREFFKDNAVDENGTSKYVVKRLQMKMMQSEKKFFMAASDLAMEAQYLSSLEHKHILKIRGWSAGGLEAYSNGEYFAYFLVLDRLQDTLDNRLKRWRAEVVKEDFKRSKTQSDLLPRTKIAFQIASALKYLHSKNIIFRDLKPNNVGFDSLGDVKLFDFGLARELPKNSGKINDVYLMSGKVGTLRYMAPEVALKEEYNQKADVYSWSILFWTCLSLSTAYENMLKSDHLSGVCIHGLRPELQSKWPRSIRILLNKSWAHNQRNRLTMKEVSSHLERIQKELTAQLELSSKSRFRLFFNPVSRIQPKSNTLASFAA